MSFPQNPSKKKNIYMFGFFTNKCMELIEKNKKNIVIYYTYTVNLLGSCISGLKIFFGIVEAVEGDVLFWFY
jgi:hypothetical protein